MGIRTLYRNELQLDLDRLLCKIGYLLEKRLGKHFKKDTTGKISIMIIGLTGLLFKI